MNRKHRTNKEWNQFKQQVRNIIFKHIFHILFRMHANLSEPQLFERSFPQLNNKAALLTLTPIIITHFNFS